MPHRYRAFMANCSILKPGASFPFPELYYRTHKIALDAMIAIGTVHPPSPSKSFLKTNAALTEILLTRRSTRFYSSSANGIVHTPAKKRAQNPILNLTRAQNTGRYSFSPALSQPDFIPPHMEVKMALVFSGRPKGQAECYRAPS